MRSLADLGADGFSAGMTEPGGADFGTGIGALADNDGSDDSDDDTDDTDDDAVDTSTGALFPRRRPGDFSTTFCSLTDRRLTGPRTGVRNTNTHPMCGTGLPPTSLPSSNSQPYSP